MASKDRQRPKAFRTDLFRSLRLEAGYQFGTDLARAMDREQQQVNAWENGTSDPSSANLVAISEFFTRELGEPISVDYLLGITEERGGRGAAMSDEELLERFIRLVQEGKVVVNPQMFTRLAQDQE